MHGNEGYAPAGAALDQHELNPAAVNWGLADPNARLASVAVPGWGLIEGVARQ